MNGIEDITRKRSILLTTRMRFSPQIQPIKESATEKILEQILFVADTGNGLSLQKIQDIFSSETGNYVISSHDIEDFLRRLAGKKRVELPIGKNKLYKLSEEARQELGLIKHQAEVRFNSAVSRLFKNAKEGFSVYNSPFFNFLCTIFSKLADEYVRVIKGDIKGDEFLSRPFVSSAFEQVEKDFKSIDHPLFRKAVVSFFQDRDPEYDAIKWNMVQSYYIAKALGLDPSGALLSTEVFGGAVFYLDTNIIIPALEPKDKHHKGFLIFNKICKQFGISLKVCQISLTELQKLISYQRELIEKVTEQIPDETASKIESTFYKIYCEKKALSEVVNIDELFASFDSPIDSLKTLFNVDLEDDVWFDEAKYKPDTMSFAEKLKSKYIAMTGRSKKDGAALHDAILLLWLQKLKQENGGNFWLVTGDRSLPGSVPKDTSIESLAITMDALMQWISPIAVPEDEEDSFTAIFAELIKNRILPQEKIFGLEDFRIFSEMHMSCKGYPAKDVEECIRYIKINAPLLDPSDPKDREKLSYNVSKFFTAPGREYQQEIARLEADKKEIKKEHEKDRKEWNRKINGLEKQFLEYRERTQKESLKRSAWRRLSMVTIIFLFLESLVVLFANKYGEGLYLFQKVSNSWCFLIGAVALTIVMGWFIMGKKRLEALGWPFMKVFKHK